MTFPDAATLTAIGAGLVSLGGLIGVAGKTWIDAIIRLRKSKTESVMEERKYADGQEREAFAQATAAYERLLQQFENRVAVLETKNVTIDGELKATRDELRKSRDEHANCMVAQETLRGELKLLQQQVDRLMNHDRRNQQQVEVLKTEVEEVKEKKKQEVAARLAAVEAKLGESGSIPVVKQEPQ